MSGDLTGLCLYMALFGCRELINAGEGLDDLDAMASRFHYLCMEGNVGTSCMTWIWNS